MVISELGEYGKLLSCCEDTNTCELYIVMELRATRYVNCFVSLFTFGFWCQFNVS